MSVQPPPRLPSRTSRPTLTQAGPLKPATPGEGSIENRHFLLPERVKGGFPSCGAHGKITLCRLLLRTPRLSTEDGIPPSLPEFYLLFTSPPLVRPRDTSRSSHAERKWRGRAGPQDRVLGGALCALCALRRLRPADKAPHGGLLTAHGSAPR